MKRLLAFLQGLPFMPSSLASTSRVESRICTLMVCNPPAGINSLHKWDPTVSTDVARMKDIFSKLRAEHFNFFPQKTDGVREAGSEVGVPTKKPTPEESYIALPTVTGG